MAAPRVIYILSDIGLKIKINKSNFHGVNYTDSPKPWKYTVTNYDQIYPANCTKVANQNDLEGWLSPTSPVTLPPMIKEKAGIPMEATSYAFMYPPQGLVEILLKRDHQNSSSDDPSSKSLQPIINGQGITSAAILGGFVYFDDNHECICINALSLERSDRTLRLLGPFKVNPSACDELYKLGRPQPLRLDSFHEVGFVSYAWVRPTESFQFKSVFATDCHAEIHKNTNGTMLFFRDNGTAEAYAVEPSAHVDPSGYVGILSDAVKKISQARLTEHLIQPINEVRDQVKHWTKSMAIAKLAKTLKDKKRLLHMACHAVLGLKFISHVLSHTSEKPHLSYQDDFGWNPLHYACRFSPSDDDLIKFLVTECPEAVVQLDHYDRSPLHIACNSETSIEVIDVLLNADRSTPKVTLNTKTRVFGLLPLHLACFNGASDGIINALLDADCDGMTATEKSEFGQLPLHLAILKKLPTCTVKAFLDADSKLSKADTSNFDTETPNFNGDIYQYFDGKIPLHLACLNNSSSEVIQLLLEKDEQNTTINETVSTAPDFVNLTESFMLQRYKKFKTGNKSPNISSLSINSEETDTREINEGVVALHLAMQHGSSDVISLLLQKEMEKERNVYQLPMVHKTDSWGKTPLHIACQSNIDHQIIQALLNVDPYRRSTQIKDFRGFMPIHYACENKSTSSETINFLLDAEEMYIKHKMETGSSLHMFTKSNDTERLCRSTHTGDIERGRTPLYLAVKAGAETKVIERLLQPEHFYLYGFDDTAMEDLANIVKKSKILQEKVIDRLSERTYFCLILLEFFACVAALVCFMIGSENYIAKNMSIPIPIVLVISASVFALRELLQIKSVGVNYIADVWSWVEIVGIVLLLVASNSMFQKGANPESENKPNLFAVTNFFIIFQVIIYLRCTFLPFARFVGGLVLILKKLMAFLVVSMLLIYAFAYAFWITDTNNSHITVLSSTKEVFGYLFEFTPPNINSLEILFGILIVIVLLNIVIAIVGEAWDSAAEKSTRMFWTYRLDKILQLRYAVEMQSRFDTLCSSIVCPVRALMMKIDSLENISLRDNISWTKAPYDILTMKDHYDNPSRYFSRDVSLRIISAHSLQADMYWAEVEGATLTFCLKFKLLLKWLGFCLLYMIMVILGIPLCGIIWPKQFRTGFLSLGLRNSHKRNRTRVVEKSV